MTDQGDRRTRRRRIALAVVVVGAAIAIGVFVMQARKPAPATASSAPPPAAAPAPAVQIAAPSAAQAFAAVYPKPDQPVAWQGKSYDVRFEPAGLYPLGGGAFALVSLGRNREDFHAAKGFYSVAYLKGAPLKVSGEVLLGSASAGGNGAPPQVSLNTRISQVPTLVVESSFMAQGDESRWADLVRLGERPAVVAEGVPLLEDNSGAFADPKDPEVRRVTGHIKGGVKDQAFAVVYQGDWAGAVVWRWDGARWRCTGDRQCPAAKR
jgi:hypothetical protein